MYPMVSPETVICQNSLKVHVVLAENYPDGVIVAGKPCVYAICVPEEQNLDSRL